MPGRARALGGWTTRASAALASALLLASAALGQSLEYPVKAAYRPKLGPFVDWPGRAFASLMTSATLV